MTNNGIDSTNILEIEVETLNEQPVEAEKQLQVLEKKDDDEELSKVLVPDIRDLPLTPPSALECNFVSYYAPGFSFSFYMNIGIIPNLKP